MVRVSLFAGAIALLLVAAQAAAAPPCTARVFDDRDADGRPGADEPGLAGVALWDGVGLRRTGADGRAPVDRAAEAPLALIKPAGWRAPARADGLPDTWRDAEARCGAVFALRRDPRPAGDLDVHVVADPQPKSAREVEFYGRATVDAIRARDAGGTAAHLGLTLGDIVDDDVSLFPAMNRLTTSLGTPWLHVPGNHDVDVAEAADADSLRSFRAAYGPDTTAWEEHEAAFVLLDDVIWRPGDGRAYVGGLREDQFRFLEAYLAGLPAQRPVVVAAHIPLFDAKPGVETFRRTDRERLFALLARFEHVLLLTGHGHGQRHHWHDAATGWRGASPLHEYSVGAACGSYWSGVDDARGVPTSTMADGTPKGWAGLQVGAHGRYALRWHVVEAGVPADAAIGLHAPRVLRRGSWPGAAVYANVFMGHADSRVEYRIDDGQWQPMQRTDRPDPRVVAQNVADDVAAELRAFDRLPEAAPSSHLWRGTLPTDLAPGRHRIQVRTYDLWRGELQAGTDYVLRDAAPD